MIEFTKAAVAPAKEIMPAAFSIALSGKKSTGIYELSLEMPKNLRHHESLILASGASRNTAQQPSLVSRRR